MSDETSLTIPARLSSRACATQWFGPVAMHPPVLSSLFSLVQGMDLTALALGSKNAGTRDAPIGTNASTQADRPLYQMAGDAAVILIGGPISKETSSLADAFGGASTIEVRRAIEMALADPKANSIVLQIDSPGGTASGVGDLWDDIIAGKKKKPIYAYVEDCCASAAFWIASACTEIYASRHADIGSIGVYSAIYDQSKAAEMQGVKVILVTTGGVKGGTLPGVQVSDEVVQEIQRGVDACNDMFLDAITTGRGMTMERVKKLNTGQMWNAKDAKRLGLIDAILPIRKALVAVQGGGGTTRTVMSASTNTVAATATTVSWSAHLASLEEDYVAGHGVFTETKASEEVMENPTGSPTETTAASSNMDATLSTTTDSPESAPEGPEMTKTPEQLAAEAAAATQASVAVPAKAEEAVVPLSKVEAMLAERDAKIEAQAKRLDAREAAEGKAKTEATAALREKIATKHGKSVESLAWLKDEESLKAYDTDMSAKRSNPLSFAAAAKANDGLPNVTVEASKVLEKAYGIRDLTVGAT